MSNLTFLEKRQLERLFCMESGYVLNFNNRTFSEFFADHAKININDTIYCKNGESKANRLRSFWSVENNYVVGTIIEALILYGRSEKCLFNDTNLIDDCQKIANRLMVDKPVMELDSLMYDERNFGKVAQHIREAIEKSQPEDALDRLHTYVIKYIRELCKTHSIEIDRFATLHGIFGKYVKYLENEGYLESKMTTLIMKSSISVLDEFNDVRNNKSLAHDNPILNYEESLLIVNHIISLIRFIKSLERKIAHMIQPTEEEDVPF